MSSKNLEKVIQRATFTVSPNANPPQIDLTPTEGDYKGKTYNGVYKIEGDTVSFVLTGKFGDQEVKLNYKGKISGNEIKFTSEMAGGGGGQPIEWTAKKQ